MISRHAPIASTAASCGTSWALRAAWGLGEVIATLRFRSEFRSVDLPTFGRPTMETNPERKPGPLSPSAESASGMSLGFFALLLGHQDFGDAPALDPLDAEPHA